jgi:hypothetical protein
MMALCGAGDIEIETSSYCSSQMISSYDTHHYHLIVPKVIHLMGKSGQEVKSWRVAAEGYV